ncbi:hypothetical protein WDJ51_06870 [Rathayibacter sp. YIM 133350]
MPPAPAVFRACWSVIFVAGSGPVPVHASRAASEAVGGAASDASPRGARDVAGVWGAESAVGVGVGVGSALGVGVDDGVGADVGVGSVPGVGSGVGSGVGVGVGVGVGFGEGVGSGAGVGSGVGVGSGAGAGAGVVVGSGAGAETVAASLTPSAVGVDAPASAHACEGRTNVPTSVMAPANASVLKADDARRRPSPRMAVPPPTRRRIRCLPDRA